MFIRESEFTEEELKQMEEAQNQAYQELEKEIIAKEHERLRALFEKKTGQHLKGLEASGYIKGRDDCLSELQEVKK